MKMLMGGGGGGGGGLCIVAQTEPRHRAKGAKLQHLASKSESSKPM